MSGAAALQEMIDRVRKLPGLVKEAAPDVAEAVEADLRRTAKAHTDPYGKAWKLTQDGREPLANAPSEITAAPIGTRIFVRLKGPSARHNNGRARGGIKREVLPDERGIPPRMAEAIGGVVGDHFARIMKGKGAP